MEDLIVEDGRVVGARVKRNGSTLSIEARKGVLLAAGGFGHNAEMRRKYSGDQPNEAQWSLANAGDTGEVLQTAMSLGAKTDLLDEAWWLPSVFIADGGTAARSLGSGRQRPGAIYVDSTGRRFCNESNSYVEVGKAMYANKAVPCWMIFDEGYVGRYVSGANPLKKRRLPEELIERGAVMRGETVGDLARQIDVPADELEYTIARFNDFAAKGLDPDFGRGQSAYNDCLGDPGYRPNAAVGPLERAPYYATRVLPADVGTCGGVITNEHAQVLDEHDRVIDGLYATGNITAAVMGRTYLGAGGSIASTMVFGYVAARHAAGRGWPSDAPLTNRRPLRYRRGRLLLSSRKRLIDEIPWLQTGLDELGSTCLYVGRRPDHVGQDMAHLKVHPHAHQLPGPLHVVLHRHQRGQRDLTDLAGHLLDGVLQVVARHDLVEQSPTQVLR